MTYEISKGGNNKIKFNQIVIYHSSTKDITNIFSDDELRNAPYNNDVKDFETVELFIDLKTNSYSNVDEVFTFKVKLNSKKEEQKKILG